jgi:hypothetical protein
MAKNTMKHYKLKKKELKDSYFTMFRARGNRVEQQVATLKVSGRPISLIRFIPKGKRKPADQKGKSIKQRRPLRIEIRPGNKKKTKLFIQKGKGGMTHVFRRKEGKKKGGKEVLAKQSAPALPELYSKVKSIRLQASITALRQYNKEFARQFKFLVNKAENKM